MIGDYFSLEYSVPPRFTPSIDDAPNVRYSIRKGVIIGLIDNFKVTVRSNDQTNNILITETNPVVGLPKNQNDLILDTEPSISLSNFLLTSDFKTLDVFVRSTGVGASIPIGTGAAVAFENLEVQDKEMSTRNDIFENFFDGVVRPLDLMVLAPGGKIYATIGEEFPEQSIAITTREPDPPSYGYTLDCTINGLPTEFGPHFFSVVDITDALTLEFFYKLPRVATVSTTPPGEYLLEIVANITSSTLLAGNPLLTIRKNVTLVVSESSEVVPPPPPVVVPEQPPAAPTVIETPSANISLTAILTLVSTTIVLFLVFGVWAIFF